MGWEQELTDAVYNNDTDVVRQFLQSEEVRKGLSRKEWIWGEAPLHRAAAIGRVEILKMLSDSGGDVNSVSIHDNEDKMTCLHLAVWCNQVETVRVLMSMGADPRKKGTWLDYTGTPADFARQYKHREIVAVFQDFASGGDGRTLSGSTTMIKNTGNVTINRLQTSTILTGLENLPTKEKALSKAIELQKKYGKAEKNVIDMKKRLAMAEKELWDVTSNPYFMTQERIDMMAMEIEELKKFAIDVRKVISDRKLRSSIPDQGEV